MDASQGLEGSALLGEYRIVLEMLATFGGMLLLMMAESVFPRIAQDDVPVARWLNNWALAILNFFFLLWLMYLVSASELVVLAGTGLLAEAPLVLAFLAVFLVVEATGYGLHRAFHAIPFLWRFHAVHHTDTEVDVTTSHRHHTFEVALVALCLVPVLIVLSAPPAAVLLYFMLRLMVVLVSHSNLHIPEALDRRLRRIVVTPDFHRLHHARDPRYTDSNFGTVTPWFDYLLGTASDLEFRAQRDLILGLESHRDARDSRLDRLLLLPVRLGSPMTHVAKAD